MSKNTRYYIQKNISNHHADNFYSQFANRQEAELAKSLERFEIGLVLTETTFLLNSDIGAK